MTREDYRWTYSIDKCGDHYTFTHFGTFQQWDCDTLKDAEDIACLFWVSALHGDELNDEQSRYNQHELRQWVYDNKPRWAYEMDTDVAHISPEYLP